jgi:hypothetical protein
VPSFNILWHTDPLLGNDHEIIEIMAAARQQPKHNNGSTIGSKVFYAIRPEAISCDRLS